MIQCKICKFSALSENHLNLHFRKHHKDLSCKECSFQTKSEYILKNHVSTMHKKNVTCKFWRQNSCKNNNCQYKHELRTCRYGNNCRRSDCMFEHNSSNQNQQNIRKNDINPWINPAFLGQKAYSENFPFLGHTQCQCQKRNPGA